MQVHPAIVRFGRDITASGPAIIRYASRHLGFLAGLLIASVALGITYRYLFDPLEQRTLPYYIRSSLHAIGLAFSGWAVHVGFASVPRSRSSGVLRHLPLPAEFAIKAFAMTAVLTIVAVSLQLVLYRELPYASAAKTSTNMVLWMVGQDLDNRRLEALQNATRTACKPIHSLADALEVVLTGQRRLRVRGLHHLLALRIQTVKTARSKPGITGQTYGAAVDDAQTAAVTLQTVRAADPQATTQALKDAHDALVVAVRNNDGQFDALITSMQTFAKRANDLAAAAGATASSSNP